MGIYPVILSGGSGTRLWPLSRKHYPKQLLPLVSKNAMLQETINRVSSLDYEPPLVICNDEHRFIVAEQLRQIEAKTLDIILEPVGRNTAPAAAVAALLLREKDPESVILLLPSDHVVLLQDAFHASINKALIAANSGRLVTFGIKPTSAETGYGYIHMGKPIAHADGCHEVGSFIEKPDSKNAEKYMKDGGYLWNSGMFLFQADAYIEELERLQPGMVAACKAALEGSVRDLDFLRLDTTAFSECPSKSIDYAVMEHTPNAAVVPADIGWSDVGSWASLWNISQKDDSGNVVIGDVLQQDTSGSYLRSDGAVLATIGITDTIIVVTGDAVLVAPKDRAQDIRELVDKLESESRNEHLTHLRVHRPWGWYQGLDRGESFQVKRLCVNPGARLSLQRHAKRAEHWVVVSGTASIHHDGEDMTLGANQSTYIPIGTAHRLENKTDEPLYLIEVQSGDYLEEDDIERLEDDYARS
ncbi:MAG: mannose-1-phosphate guanylyltransferase/mannose-6-phosphate isomerase [Rhodospirillaceae bacterium]|nr:mannose-1-phosphate guanylyltransferase/mannose-6-phosphate isomerase [Rhodospirillaceae bacterium]